MIAFLDTHAFLALAEGRPDRFGRSSKRLLTGADLAISPAVLLEMHLLREVGRLHGDPDQIYRQVTEDVDVAEAADPLIDVVRRAADLSWTRDPFDRLIVATAMLHDARLITRDRNIHDHFEGAVW